MERGCSSTSLESNFGLCHVYMAWWIPFENHNLSYSWNPFALKCKKLMPIKETMCYLFKTTGNRIFSMQDHI